MCLAIYLPADKQATIEQFKNGYMSNSHGAGFMYAQNKELIIKKGYFTFEKFWESYSQVPVNVPRVVHFRHSTGGKTNKENCHPFSINPGLGFVHNGTFSKINACDKYSDTHYFNTTVMRPVFNRDFKKFLQPHYKWLIKESIGLGNKLIFLNKLGEFWIANEQAGDWVDGIWFSNTSHKYIKSRVSSFQHNRGLYYQGRNVQTHFNNYQDSLGWEEYDDAPNDCQSCEAFIEESFNAAILELEEENKIITMSA